MENDQSPKDHWTPTTLGSNTSDTKINIKMVIILGDSMMKQTNGCKISKKLPLNTMVYVKHCLVAKTRCMEDYSKPSLYDSPDHFILHMRTNDK